MDLFGGEREKEEGRRGLGELDDVGTNIPSLQSTKKNDANNSRRDSQDGTLPVPTPENPTGTENTIEIPATRSSVGDVEKLMHSLSVSPHQRGRRGSRNSFGASLPIPRVKRPSHLSRPGMIAEEKASAVKNLAFVFDIDGLLVHGDRPIPEGQKNELGVKIPHIFLTNGSGKTEAARCAQLSKILKSPYYHTVLVGGEGYRFREVAELYGFKDVVVPNDIVAWDGSTALYRTFGTWERESARPRDFNKTNIEAILVFSDSRDYAMDAQIIMDLLQSENGRLGTRSKDPISQQIPIYFSHGTFGLALKTMCKSLTGVELERTIYGKPERATYTYADDVLTSWMEEIHSNKVLPENVYMIGDNLQSDIICGNLYGWNTCLGGKNDKENPAPIGVLENALAAVTTAMPRELGEGFKFDLDAENPVLVNRAMSAVEV
ncbi:HAD-superfamily subfamily IIA hydrolase [Choiromyces venosus 120613-1]|uniref:HAD-superfamily subfamily IIA hydrolase n=1 Tax=Choiromyces venosus 120613-1 TaxID=1336337 RepID=A0A3N4JLN4_9PEZI|nr:HAD-superfamily subfamily IIA hydrolase [Choiromyces venosus 120613-1]